jgi:hypothetical protein
VYIDRRDDGNTIFGKAFEFSSKTIKELETAGYHDAKLARQAAFLQNAITDLHDKSLLTEHEASLLEQNLSKAMIYTKHMNPLKAAGAIDDFIEKVEYISTYKEPAVKNRVSELAQFARLLQEQL